jgi:hypothetical protein
LSSEQRQFGLSEGLAVAAVPAVSYAMAFLFEAGYCAHFGIPWTFITVSLTSIFTVFFVLFTTLLLVFLLANGAFGILYPHAWRTPIGRELVAATSVSILFLGVLLLAKPERPWLYFGIYVFLLALNLLWPLVTQRKVGGGYGAKAEAQAELERQVVMGIDYRPSAPHTRNSESPLCCGPRARGLAHRRRRPSSYPDFLSGHPR